MYEKYRFQGNVFELYMMNSVRDKKWIKVILIVIAILLTAYFSFRNTLLNYTLSRVIHRVNDRFSLEFNVRNHGFNGFNTIWLTGITVNPKNGDTLLQVDTVSFRPDFIAIITGSFGISDLFLQNGEIKLNTSLKGNNMEFLHHAASIKRDTVKISKSGYATFVNNALDRIFALAPQQAEILNMSIAIQSDSFLTGIVLKHYQANKDFVCGEVDELNKANKWFFQGNFNKHKRNIALTIYPGQRSRQIPLFQEVIGAVAGFDTLQLRINDISEHHGVTMIGGNCTSKGFYLYHKRLATDTINFAPSTFDFALRFDETSFSLDSASRISLGKLNIKPFIKYDKSAKAPVYQAKMTIDTVNGTDFFGSLPSGMFGDVRTIKADGQLSFSLNFLLNAAKPEDVVFKITLNKKGFRIRDYGTSGLLKLNNEFVHDVYEKDVYVRSFPVGPSNPAFTPLSDVAVDFRNSVLTSEDGNFFIHNGFNEDAFRKSIADNYKAGKFVRGGSTITMQLVKNVFLTRKKTVARKAEEALMVWLIESGRLVSKERLLEVYFNIIELGPGVYGIGEASTYYFSKKPSQLTLNESIFLASLLPHPKAFKYSFDSTGVLKPYLADYYRVMSNFMLRKSLISQEAFDNLVPQVKLKGRALEVLPAKDTLIDY